MIGNAGSGAVRECVELPRAAQHAVKAREMTFSADLNPLARRQAVTGIALATPLARAPL